MPPPPVTLIVAMSLAKLIEPIPLPAKLNVFADPTGIPAFSTTTLPGTTFVMGACESVEKFKRILPAVSSYVDVSRTPSTVEAVTTDSETIS